MEVTVERTTSKSNPRLPQQGYVPYRAGLCEYWQQSPEAVYEMRRIADIAFQ